MNEVEQVHLATLKLVIKLTSQQYAQQVAEESVRRATGEEAERYRRQAVADVASRLRLDDSGSGPGVGDAVDHPR